MDFSLVKQFGLFKNMNKVANLLIARIEIVRTLVNQSRFIGTVTQTNKEETLWKQTQSTRTLPSVYVQNILEIIRG